MQLKKGKTIKKLIILHNDSKIGSIKFIKLQQRIPEQKEKKLQISNINSNLRSYYTDLVDIKRTTMEYSKKPYTHKFDN